MDLLDDTVGIVLRYADNMLGTGVDTIAEHNAIVKKYGRAFVGKVGKFIGSRALKICNDNNINKYLILVKKGKGKYIFHFAPIASAQSEYPKADLIPEYYRANKDIVSWICIKGQFRLMSEKEINSWQIISSGFNILDSLRRSMASYFLVTK